MDQPLPAGLTLARTTPEFTAMTVPAGLLKAHRVADGVWGRLRVLAGSLTFAFEDGEQPPRTVDAGQEQVIPPGRAHAVTPAADARFVIDFFR